MENTKKILFAARNTLDDVDVRGVENMRKILGCYDALGTVLQNLESDPADVQRNQKEDEYGQR